MKVSADKIFINAKAYTLEAEGVCKEEIGRASCRERV